MSDFTFFWDGPFSNWYTSPFVHNGVQYNCGEQYMMHQKALLFNDTEVAQLIMEETHPRKQKALGREVRGFDIPRWDAVCLDIVFDGLLCKFQQNADLKQILLDT